MVDQEHHRMALLVHNADHHSEGYSLDCHVRIVKGMHARRQSSEWLERMGKATLSERVVVRLEG